MPTWTRDTIIDRIKAVLVTVFTDYVYIVGFPTRPPEPAQIVTISDPAERLEGTYKSAARTIELVITITSAPAATEEAARAAAINTAGLALVALGANRRLKNVGGTPLIDGMIPTRIDTLVDNMEVSAPLGTAVLTLSVTWTGDPFTM